MRIRKALAAVAAATAAVLGLFQGAHASAYYLWEHSDLLGDHTGYCVADPWNSTVNSTQLTLYTCQQGLAGEGFALQFSPYGRGYDQIVLQNGKCVDDRLDGTGNAVQVYTCNGSAAQAWTTVGYGTYQTWVNANGACIDVQDNNNANGTPVQMRNCAGNNAQAFIGP